MRISIAGYYGFGNAGDEAMGQAVASRLAGAGHTVFIQSESPALYHGCAYREMNARQTAEHVDRLIIGGGDLGTGFAWNLIPFALHAGRQVYLAGMEFPHQWTGNGHEKAARLIRAVLESCAQIWPRNSAGYRRSDASGNRDLGGLERPTCFHRERNPVCGDEVRLELLADAEWRIAAGDFEGAWLRHRGHTRGRDGGAFLGRDSFRGGHARSLILADSTVVATGLRNGGEAERRMVWTEVAKSGPSGRLVQPVPNPAAWMRAGKGGRSAAVLRVDLRRVPARERAGPFLEALVGRAQRLPARTAVPCEGDSVEQGAP